MSSTKPANRRRSSSVTNALNQIPLNTQDGNKREALTPPKGSPIEDTGIKPLSGKPRPRRDRNALPENYTSLGLWGDIQTGRWMLVPSSAFILMAIPALYNLNHMFLVRNGYLSPNAPNPTQYIIYPQGKLPNGMYETHWADYLFVAYHIIFWSFVRQFMTIHVFRPMAIALGIKGGKIMRFTEQGYAFFYFSITGTLGIMTMRTMPIWWYRTEHIFLGYPHRQIPFGLKLFYLLQASYWTQQLIILAARIEKPRKDFKELVAHHFVTLYLIFWSYVVHFTYIGLLIFVSMDVSDVFLALAKCVNYVNENASVPIFAFFVCVWTYFRHYLNIVILWSIITEFHLIPAHERQAFLPLEDKWAAPWMQWMMFLPIFALQLINLFWYFLILRILFRAVFGPEAKDERSDDEEEPEETKKSQ